MSDKRRHPFWIDCTCVIWTTRNRPASLRRCRSTTRSPRWSVWPDSASISRGGARFWRSATWAASAPAPTLARALHDSDRVVRILAENGIFDLWCRDGSDSQQQQMRIIVRLNDALQFEEAHALASQLIDEAPQFAEAWNQRAIASYRLGRYEDAANDCQQTLELNPYHFAAALGMAHCYLELGEGWRRWIVSAARSI